MSVSLGKRTSPRRISGQLMEAINTSSVNSTERVSIELIIEKLCNHNKQCPDTNDRDQTQECATTWHLVTKQITSLLNACTAANCISAMYCTILPSLFCTSKDVFHDWIYRSFPTSSGEHISNVILQTPVVSPQKSLVGIGHGLFASPARVLLQKSHEEVISSISDVTLSETDRITSSYLCTCFENLLAVGTSLIRADAECRLLSGTYGDIVNQLHDKHELLTERALESIVQAWQACTVALSQTLLNELSHSMQSVNCRKDYNVRNVALKDVPLSDTAQLSQQHLGVNVKHSPHLFGFYSQISQPTYMAGSCDTNAKEAQNVNLPGSYPTLESLSPAVGELFSHPKAHETTIQLFSTVVKVSQLIYSLRLYFYAFVICLCIL